MTDRRDELGSQVGRRRGYQSPIGQHGNLRRGVFTVPESYTVLETFDNGLTKYSGDTSYFSVVQAPTIDGGGGNVMEMASDDFFVEIYTSGRSDGPQPGDTFDVWMRPTEVSTNSQMNFQFGREDTDNLYKVRVFFDDNITYLQTVDAGNTTTTIGSTWDRGTASVDTWYRVRVYYAPSGERWEVETFEVDGTVDKQDDTLLDSETSTEDTGLNSGTDWGWKGHNPTGNPIYVDHARFVE